MSSHSAPNETGANAGQRLGLAVKSRFTFRYRSGVAQFTFIGR